MTLIRNTQTRPVNVMCCGVSGCSKSTVARNLVPEFYYLNSDALHLDSAKDKIRHGKTPTDEERMAWIQRLKSQLQAHSAAGKSVVCDASLLRREYRDSLRGAPVLLLFVLLVVPRSVALNRVRERSRTDPNHLLQGSFDEFVDEQFAALEMPYDEPDVIVVDGRTAASEICRQVRWHMAGMFNYSVH